MSDTKKDEKLVLDGVGSEGGSASSNVEELVDRTDPAIEKAAEENLAKITNFSKEDLDTQDMIKASINNLGAELQKENAKFSPMLKQTVGKLSKSVEGGATADALIQMKMICEELDPSSVNFSPGWFSRAAGKIPFIGNPIKRYFTKYESIQTVIEATMNSLKMGKEELIRDNKTLSMDQRRMKELSFKLQKAIAVARLMDEKLTYKLEREVDKNSEESKFLQEEVMFPLRQRIMDIQQTLAVVQQGYISFDVIIRGNKELINACARVENTTISALSVASIVAVALAGQRIVLDKVQAINNTTNNLLASTAQQLKTQGVEISKASSEALLDVEKLKQAFSDVQEAVTSLSTYRTESLSKMGATIEEMAKMNANAQDAIQDMEKGKKVREKIELEIK